MKSVFTVVYVAGRSSSGFTPSTGHHRNWQFHPGLDDTWWRHLKSCKKLLSYSLERSQASWQNPCLPDDHKD